MFYFYDVSHIQSILCMHTKLTLIIRNYLKKTKTEERRENREVSNHAQQSIRKKKL